MIFFFFSWNSLFDYLIWGFFLAFVCSHLTNIHTHWSWLAALYPKETVKQTNLKELWLKNLTHCRRPCLCERMTESGWGWGGGEGISGVTMCVWQECFCGWFLLLFPPVSSGVDRTGGSSERTAASDKTLGEDDVCHLGIECVCVFAWARWGESGGV